MTGAVFNHPGNSGRKGIYVVTAHTDTFQDGVSGEGSWKNKEEE